MGIGYSLPESTQRCFAEDKKSLKQVKKKTFSSRVQCVVMLEGKHQQGKMLLDALVGCQRFGDAATLQSQSWWILKVSGHSLLGGLSGLMHHKASKE